MSLGWASQSVSQFTVVFLINVHVSHFFVTNVHEQHVFKQNAVYHMASGDRLQGLQLKLLREKQAAAGMEREAASEGLASVSLCLAKLEKVSTKVTGRDVLEAVQLELEGSAGLVVTNMLGSMPRLAKPLGWQWQMPSDHLPIGAVICVAGRKLRAASYNVLNKRYYKYIQSDSQGLQGSLISTLHGTPDEGAGGEEGDALADGRERRVAELVFAMLHPPPPPHFERVHLLSLQECSPDFLRILKKKLNKHGRYEVLQSGEEDANQEAPRDPLRESEISHYPTKSLAHECDIFVEEPRKTLPRNLRTLPLL